MTYYLKGGSVYDDPAARAWMALHLSGFSSGDYEDTGWKHLEDSGATGDPFWLLGGAGGDNQVEIGLSGSYRIRITTSDIFGWHQDSGAWFSLFGSGVFGTGVSDHGLLGGLGGDDHTQYHNNARGDARYYLQSISYHSGEIYHSGETYHTGYIQVHYVSGNVFIGLSGDFLVLSGDYITHINNTNAHHTRYTDIESRAAINGIFGSDGKADKDIDMDGTSTYKIIHLGNPSASGDAVNLGYLESELTSIYFADLVDITNQLSGVVKSLDDKNYTFPSNPIDAQLFYDRTSESFYRYNENATAWIEIGGGGNAGFTGIGDNLGNHAATQILDMSNYRITGMADPVDDQDGATKKWIIDNYPESGDNLGNHIATQDLNMSGYDITGGRKIEIWGDATVNKLLTFVNTDSGYKWELSQRSQGSLGERFRLYLYSGAAWNPQMDFLTGGEINLYGSFDSDDYLQFYTLSNIPRMKTIGNSDFYFESDGGYMNFQTGVIINYVRDVSLLDGDASLIIGDPSGSHIEFDNNEILQKSDATTAGQLHLQADGGQLDVGLNTAVNINFHSSTITGNAADLYHTFGRAGIGHPTYSNYASFQHRNMSGAGEYALLQSAAGTTYLNSNSLISFRINNTGYMNMSSAGLQIGSDQRVNTIGDEINGVLNTKIVTESGIKAYVDANAGDNLGNHSATQALDMNGYNINDVSHIQSSATIYLAPANDTDDELCIGSLAGSIRIWQEGSTDSTEVGTIGYDSGVPATRRPFYSIYSQYLFDDDGVLGSYSHVDDLQLLRDLQEYTKEKALCDDFPEITQPVWDFNTLPWIVAHSGISGLETGSNIKRYSLPLGARDGYYLSTMKKLLELVDDQQLEILDLKNRITTLESGV